MSKDKDANIKLSLYLKGSRSKGYTTNLAFEDNFISGDDGLVSAEVMKSWAEEQSRVLRRSVNLRFPKFVESE